MTGKSILFQFRVEISGPFVCIRKTHFRHFKKYRGQDTEKSFNNLNAPFKQLSESTWETVAAFKKNSFQKEI